METSEYVKTQLEDLIARLPADPIVWILFIKVAEYIYIYIPNSFLRLGCFALWSPRSIVDPSFPSPFNYFKHSKTIKSVFCLNPLPIRYQNLSSSPVSRASKLVLFVLKHHDQVAVIYTLCANR